MTWQVQIGYRNGEMLFRPGLAGVPLSYDMDRSAEQIIGLVGEDASGNRTVVNQVKTVELSIGQPSGIIGASDPVAVWADQAQG